MDYRTMLMSLIGDANANHVGYAYEVKYGEMSILTNDFWKERVNGIPQSAFLVASAIPARSGDVSEIEREVILLRVTGEFELPGDKEMQRAVIDKHKRRDRMDDPDGSDGFDPVTHMDLQWGGMKARILGTFYVDQRNNLKFGSDIENFPSASHLRVFKPEGDALSAIVNWVDPGRRRRMQEEAMRKGFAGPLPEFDIGYVRYTSTSRLHDRSKATVPVQISSADFLGRRTACFGMTRTGKSNLVKTVVSAVRLAAAQGAIPIGQLIFDLNGEYANANAQDDGSGIADVFREDTVRYRGLPSRGFLDLRNNFYDAIGPGLAVIQNVLDGDRLNSSADIRNLIEMSLDEPEDDDWSEKVRWKVRKAIYACILYRAGFKPPKNWLLKFDAGKEVMDQIERAAIVPTPIDEDTSLEAPPAPAWWKSPDEGLTLDEACDWFKVARRADVRLRKDDGPGIRSASGNQWLDSVSRSLLNILVQRSDTDNYIRGFKVLTNVAQYHSPSGPKDVASDIYEFLSRGKIVILDLSVGIPSIRQDMAERIAKNVFDRSMGAFTNGETPPDVVMYVEEAHNLIGKDASLDTTWPRIAKEGAKFGISLVYATQEPSSIHANILSNTENWFVTHLNNDDEISALGKFYDFADFGLSLKKVPDVGFARVKTLSSSFVVPVQIKLFDPREIRSEFEYLGGASKMRAGMSRVSRTMSVENPVERVRKPAAQQVAEQEERPASVSAALSDLKSVIDTDVFNSKGS